MFSHFKWLRYECPAIFFLCLALRVSVFMLLLQKLIVHKLAHAGLCALTLLLCEIPLLLRLFGFYTPPLFELIVTLFAMSANIFGEIFEFYLIFPFWDSVLHFIWGFLAALFGISFFEAISNNSEWTASLSPMLFALLALSFAALTSVFWEIFEYGMDCIFLTDMQKDCYLSSVNSILLNPAGVNVPVREEISSVVINGSAWISYIDIGLNDTMSDILFNTFGSLISSVMLFFGCRRGKTPVVFLLLAPRRLYSGKDDTSP